MMKIRHRAESLLSRSLLWIEMMPQMVCNIHYSCKNIRNIYTNYSLNQATKIFAFVTIVEILEAMAWILSRIRKNCKTYKERNQILCKRYNWGAQASSELCLLVKQGVPESAFQMPELSQRAGPSLAALGERRKTLECHSVFRTPTWKVWMIQL